MDFDEDPDYLDLDDILTQTQRVMCKFLVEIPGLEFLSPDISDDSNIQGKWTLLPFWLARTLYTYSMIDIELPHAYNQHGREQFDLEPDIADLHRLGPYFYQFGILLMNLRREKGNNLAAFTEEGQRNKYRREEGESLEEKRDIAQFLMFAFHLRRKMILEFSINNRKQDGFKASEFEKRLDNLERKLFRLGQKQLKDWNIWNSVNNDRVTSSQIAVQLTKKRKIQASHEENIK